MSESNRTCELSDSVVEHDHYVVLARKYRPETFEDIIGQEPMVKTLCNAFELGRIAQGYMLTGVRGVGKTTTARIIARALNYSHDGLVNKATVNFHGYGPHCKRILRSGHPDVFEIDAASNTGVDNIREIIQNTNYNTIEARYKVYIIDEVHMLSKGAFNALLKTLEEPPQHVKFIFATTEIRKVPVTVLSRCQRFDLQRVEALLLIKHFTKILENEGAKAEERALNLIARAADGSVRDGLSLLDQAITLGSGSITLETVNLMFGLADRHRILDMFETMLSGKTASVLDQFITIYNHGTSANQVLKDLAEIVHSVTRYKVSNIVGVGNEVSEDEKHRICSISEQVSVALLSRVWQMLLKGIEEVGNAPNPETAAEMVLIRISYTADMPTPGEIIKALGSSNINSTKITSSSFKSKKKSESHKTFKSAENTNTDIVNNPKNITQAAQKTTAVRLNSFDDVLDLIGQNRDAMLKMHLEEHVSLISFKPGRIEFYPMKNAPQGLAGELEKKLIKWTKEHWVVVVGDKHGFKPVGQIRDELFATEVAEIKKHPAVSNVLEVFPDAEITDIKPTSSFNSK